MIEFLKLHLSKKTLLRGVVLLLMAALGYWIFFGPLTFTPSSEAQQMQQLQITKQQETLSEFVSDGCSGNVSSGWTEVVSELSDISDTFAKSYSDVLNVPFEAACIQHDRTYHTGVGGYAGRLQADNQLRMDIVQYGIDNAAEIQQRAQLNTSEEAIFLYETIAEAVYRGVRLGGAPCTGQAYAWGYGYDGGECLDSE